MLMFKSAILASFLLDEKLGRLGICGCAACIVSKTSYPRAITKHVFQIGSVIIVLHAPSDKEVETVDEILSYAARPGYFSGSFCVFGQN